MPVFPPEEGIVFGKWGYRCRFKIVVIHKTCTYILVAQLGHFKVPVFGLVVRVIESKVLYVKEIGLGFRSSVFSYANEIDAGAFGIVFSLFPDLICLRLCGRCRYAVV